MNLSDPIGSRRRSYVEDHTNATSDCEPKEVALHLKHLCAVFAPSGSGWLLFHEGGAGKVQVARQFRLVRTELHLFCGGTKSPSHVIDLAGCNCRASDSAVVIDSSDGQVRWTLLPYALPQSARTRAAETVGGESGWFFEALQRFEEYAPDQRLVMVNEGDWVGRQQPLLCAEYDAKAKRAHVLIGAIDRQRRIELDVSKLGDAQCKESSITTLSISGERVTFVYGWVDESARASTQELYRLKLADRA